MYCSKPFIFSSGDGKENYYVDFEDQVARGSCVLHEGEMMWPPPKIADPSPPPRPPTPSELKAAVEPNYFGNTLKDAGMYTAGLGSLVGTLRYCVVKLVLIKESLKNTLNIGDVLVCRFGFGFAKSCFCNHGYNFWTVRNRR